MTLGWILPIYCAFSCASSLLYFLVFLLADIYYLRISIRVYLQSDALWESISFGQDLKYGFLLPNFNQLWHFPSPTWGTLSVSFSLQNTSMFLVLKNSIQFFSFFFLCWLVWWSDILTQLLCKSYFEFCSCPLQPWIYDPEVSHPGFRVFVMRRML